MVTQMMIIEVAGDGSIMVITSALGDDDIHKTTMMAMLQTKVAMSFTGVDCDNSR